MAANTNPPRHQAGAQVGNVKIGGRFAEHLHSQPVATLGQPGRDVMGDLHARRQQLRQAGYMPAGSGIADGSPRSTAHIERWWETHFNRAEFAPEQAGSYHLMPDDYTPNMTGGRALSEHRRTHRMLYKGAGVAVRMPSATSVRRYSKEVKYGTFDLPIEAEYPGGTISGYVRVTQNGPNSWSVSGLNMPDAANAYVSEAIQATLEDRRPSTALHRVPDLLERRRARFASGGVKLNPVEHSAWIRGMGYNDANKQMVIQLGQRTYSYRVSREAYEAAKTSWSPGRIYNELVKGKPRQEISFHDKCGRYFDANLQHRCPSQHRQRDTTVKLFRNRVKNRVLGQGSAAPRSQVIVG